MDTSDTLIAHVFESQRAFDEAVNTLFTRTFSVCVGLITRAQFGSQKGD